MITNSIIGRTMFSLVVLCKVIILTNFIVHAEWNVQGILKSRSNEEDKAAHFDENSSTLFVPKIDADIFVGNSLNFQGADLTNAHLVNVTIDGHIPHLAIDSLEIKAESGSLRDGIRMATFNPRGGLSTAAGVKWDERKEALQLNRLSSSSSEGICIDSDIDMKSNVLRNFKLDKGIILKNVRIESSEIIDTKLINTTLDDLALGSIKVISLSISSLEETGSFLTTMSTDGNIATSDALQDSIETLIVKKKVEFTDTVNFKGSKLENVHITSGELNGNELDLNVKNIKTNSLVLKDLKEDKSHLKDALVVARDDGSLTSSNILLDNGWIRDMKVFGTVDFKGKYVDSENTRVPGKLLGPVIEGGKVKGLEELSVSGHTSLGDGLNVKGDVFIDGILTVGGSVLGSGPYIDVSDERLKTKIERISSTGMVRKLTRLKAVKYELKNHNAFSNFHHATKNPKEIGFLAQEVEEIFPELVTVRSDGFLGVQYSRFVPLIMAGMQDIQDQMRGFQREIGLMKETIVPLMTSDIQDQLIEFQRENKLMKETMNELKNHINFLDARKDAVVSKH